MFTGVSDVFLPVRDLDRSIEWYSSVMGFKLKFRDDERKAAGMWTGNDGGVMFGTTTAHRISIICMRR